MKNKARAHVKIYAVKNTAEKVYKQLEEDYPKESIQWVKTAKWQGPLDVPLSAMDFSNQKNWAAAKDPDHVQDFVDIIKDGQETKPIILVNEPNNEKLIIVDGHHRSLAYKRMGTNPYAYVATVDKMNGPWQRMHRQQDGLEGSSQQKSEQKSKQKSQQK